MPEGRRPRGVTLCPRSGAAAKSARLQQHRNGGEELPRSGGAAKRSYPASEVKGGGREELPRVRGCNERSYPASEVRGSGWEELPHTTTPEARGGGREDQLHVQGAVAAQVQEGLQELSHIEGQEGQQ